MQTPTINLADVYNLKTTKTTFYGLLIQDSPGEPVRETIGHINPRYHHYPPHHSTGTSNQSSPFTTNQRILYLTSNSSYPLHYFLPCSFWSTSRSNTVNHKIGNPYISLGLPTHCHPFLTRFKKNNKIIVIK